MNNYSRIMTVCILTMIIHSIDTLSYSTRIAGIRTKRLAVALSLFNIIVLVSRTSNMIQAPLVGSIVDHAIKYGSSGVLEDFRLIIFSATIGSIVGAIVIPTFINIFSYAINRLEIAGSVPNLLVQTLSIKTLKRVKKSITIPKPQYLHEFRHSGIPINLILYHTIITSIYTVGVLASVYSGTIIPEYRLTASQLSGIINGIATILYAVVVDPTAAMITDQTLQGKRPYKDVNFMVTLLVLGKIGGTLLGQLIFLPAVDVIVAITKFIA
ncbi:lipid II flippase Amj family protein [Mahella australiensis]|uniref:Lipid II flippase Amj n=1 Tax=Mahella australiensis (strain DSM 15567 / CIP 107919 / 50-1 BON) TaxID=697281 RepID=F4A1M7_MAHA5|nr:lipid II flippase Amj family protein [Mahella australiensis]AEE97077.1 hypothetical protein Mahau_1901 [Mahella australiensis 50-1 BON]